MESNNLNEVAGSGRITGVFKTREDAERVFEQIRDRGYDKGDIDVLMSEETRKSSYSQPTGNSSEMGDRAMEGAGVGSAIGGTVGAVVGAVAAIGTSLVLPGLGLIIAGPIAAALAGAGAGGLTGGLLGALVGSGVPDEDAEVYEQHLKNGGTALAVTPKNADDAKYLRRIFNEASGGVTYDTHLRASDPDYTAGHAQHYAKTAQDDSGSQYFGAGHGYHSHAQEGMKEDFHHTTTLDGEKIYPHLRRDDADYVGEHEGGPSEAVGAERAAMPGTPSVANVQPREGGFNRPTGGNPAGYNRDADNITVE